MGEFQALRFEVLEKIARLTLARPERGNAIDMIMRSELRLAVRRVAEDGEIRALVIAGEGRNFCTGGDIAAMQEAGISDAAEGRRRLADYIDLVQQLILLEKPVVAAVQGHAAGGGFGLALAADFVLAAPDACFTASFARVGLVPDFGLTWTLPRLVGMPKARELIYSARRIEAAEALRIGMIHDVVDNESLPQTAFDLAAGLTTGSPAAFALAKQALNRSLNADLHSQLEFEASAQGICFTTEWHKQAIARFLAKQSSPFKGISATTGEKV